MIDGNATAMEITTEAVGRSVRAAARIAPEREIEGDSRLVEDLGIDSLDLVGVLLKVQDDFGVEIEDDDIVKLTTIARLTEYVRARKSA